MWLAHGLIQRGLRSREPEYPGDVVSVEIVTMIGALTGAVSGVAAVIVVLVVNGKVDRLTGRVDGLESTMQTVVTARVGRAGADR